MKSSILKICFVIGFLALLIFAILYFTCIRTKSNYSGPKQIIFIRHAEKPSGSKSDPDNGQLSDLGVAHSSCWVKFFQNIPSQVNVNKPDIIYAMKQHKPTSSNRPYNTILPLSKYLNIPINNSIERDDTKGIANAILSNSDKTVLVCWEHKAIPDIANKLFNGCVKGWGADPSKKTDDEDYNTMWIYDITESAKGKQKVNLSVYYGCGIDANNNCIIPSPQPPTIIKC
jgi:hypothetical protein